MTHRDLGYEGKVVGIISRANRGRTVE